MNSDIIAESYFMGSVSFNQSHGYPIHPYTKQWVPIDAYTTQRVLRGLL